jgi:predicted nucleic acid-binding protein
MIRVVVDTNVLVSALLTRGGLPEAAIDLAISGEVHR